MRTKILSGPMPDYQAEGRLDVIVRSLSYLKIMELVGAFA
jgi:hypothetical protein